jgi:hypothetical protein
VTEFLEHRARVRMRPPTEFVVRKRGVFRVG